MTGSTWQPAPALSTALGAIATMGLLAVALNRPDLVVVVLPIAAMSLLALLRRAYRLPEVTVQAGAATLLEGESTFVHWHISAEETVDALQLRLQLRGHLDQPEGGRLVVTSVLAGTQRRFGYRLVSTRWGRGYLDGVLLEAYTAMGLLRAVALVPATGSIRVLPLREGFTAVDAVPVAAGVVGLHRSRRTGEGIDLAGVRPFTPGDRLHRINWPVSTRTGALHVTNTYSDRDADVVLVLDTSVEVGESGDGDRSSSSLDQAVRAAGAIAEHYLRNGDRVGLLDLSRPGRPIRSRAGRGQLDRLVEILLETRAGAVGQPAIERALSRIPVNALVIVLSPLLSDEVGQALAGLTRAGRSMIVVDTLPDRIELTELGQWTKLAWRVQLLRRDNLVAALAAHGVPAVPWLGAGSLDAVLLGLSRLAAAPRLRR
ncbi:MAG TPA: DUF58 domain-containing protein [Jatrophihabitans sp.]|nr:DUF58 domain-containing protein [Jatrophihabitans sp.]